MDGFIADISNSQNLAINPLIDILDKPYIEEFGPLKFEVGKFYKNRKGEKWLCAFIGSEGLIFPVKLVSQINGKDSLFTLKGRYDITEKISQNDIIGEWED